MKHIIIHLCPDKEEKELFRDWDDFMPPHRIYITFFKWFLQ